MLPEVLPNVNVEMLRERGVRLMNYERSIVKAGEALLLDQFLDPHRAVRGRFSG